MNARLWWLLLLCLPLQALAEVRIRDDRGVMLTWPRSPQRIVSLLPSLTESVCALGACDRLVGTDRFSNAPPQVLALPKLGGLEDAQIERIVSLKPDVVLVEPSARATERLESLGLKVLVIDAKTHADVKRSLRLLGELLGLPEAAQDTWARIESALAQASARVPPAVRGQRVYFEVDSTPYAAGAGSFIGETLLRLGMGNVVPPELGPFPRLNPEFVIKARPDIVIAAQRNLDEMPGRPGWAALSALKQRRSCGFDIEHYELLIRPGPRMGEAAQLLATCLAGLPEAAHVRR
ncbi:MAG TPA: helical backbone metal receptor [Rhizobacter sp.]|nr:helical backbone metal receptor [Rhizobacter sp.]